MGLEMESLTIQSRPGDNTGVGTNVCQIDFNGVVAYAPTRHKQDANILHEKVVINIDVKSTIVSNYIFFCNDGVFQVSSATYMSQVAGTGGACTLDLRVCGNAVAPSAGVTQFTTTFDLTTAAQALARGVVIAAPTEIGPGTALALVLTGTPTSVVGLLSIQLVRIR